MNYYSTPAYKHTNKMVKQIEGMGIKTLSYFIKDNYCSGELVTAFRTMYGNGAEFVDVTNIPQITKTMNSLFLRK